MKQLEMKHTALILSSCSWSCCTFRKFIIRWLYPQCFPCSTLYNQQFIFLSLKKKTQQQQNPQLQRKKRGRKYKQKWLKICFIASSPWKKKKNQMLSFLCIPANFCWSTALFYHRSFPLCCISFLFTVFIFPVIFFLFPCLSCTRFPVKGSHTWQFRNKRFNKQIFIFLAEWKL